MSECPYVIICVCAYVLQVLSTLSHSLLFVSAPGPRTARRQRGRLAGRPRARSGGEPGDAEGDPARSGKVPVSRHQHHRHCDQLRHDPERHV